MEGNGDGWTRNDLGYRRTEPFTSYATELISDEGVGSSEIFMVSAMNNIEGGVEKHKRVFVSSRRS